MRLAFFVCMGILVGIVVRDITIIILEVRQYIKLIDSGVLRPEDLPIDGG